MQAMNISVQGLRVWNPKPCPVAEEEADEGKEEKEEEEEEEAGEEVSRGQTHTAPHIESRETRATDVLDDLLSGM